MLSSKLIQPVEYKLPNNKQNELVIFMQTIGLKDATLTLCKAGQYLYVACDLLANILSVKLTDFMAVAKVNIDYVKFKGAICVSKYGITKLIAKSTQPVAYRIQDYMYDLLYRAESGENISKNLESRKQLMQQLEEEYENIVGLSKDQMADLAAADQTLKQLQDENKYLMDELEETKTTLSEYMDIANKLGRYVRLKPNPPPEAESTLLDYDDYDPDTIVAQALEAKNLSLLKKPKAKSGPKQTNDLQFCAVHFYRSAFMIDGKYRFSCNTATPDDHLVYLSNNWLLDENGPPPEDPVYYNSMECPKQTFIMLQEILEHFGGLMDEEIINKILVL